MLGEFLHWYPGYTAEAALAMPASRFFALLRAVRKMKAAEDLRRLGVAAAAAHPGQRGEQLNELSTRLIESLGQAAPKQSSVVIPGITPGVRLSDDDIAGELQAKLAAYHAARAAERAVERSATG